MEPLGVKDYLIGGVRNIQKALKVILKGDGSLDGLYSRLVERFKVFWTPQVSGYQIEPLGVKDKLIGGVTITAFWMILTPPVRLTLTPKWFHLIP